jgi:hypothetical protein
MESVAFDNRAGHSFATKNFFEGSSHRRGAGTRGAGDDDNGMFFRQASSPCADPIVHSPALTAASLSPAPVRAYE